VLLDASGSMKANDPSGLRKAAAGVVVSMLDPAGQVAILDFDAEARLLTPGDGWIVAGQTDRALAAIGAAGQSGEFTDFREGLARAAEVFRAAPAGHRKILLLLSDGILEPNPFAEAYAPHHLEYRLRRAGARGERRRALNEEFLERLSPVARRILRERLLPELRELQVEIFTVGLGPGADLPLLRELAAATTRTPLEVHSFHAQRATDLLEVFARAAEAWSGQTILERGGGPLGPETAGRVFVDDFVTDPRVVFLLDGSGEPAMSAPAGRQPLPVELGHPALAAFRLAGGSEWEWMIRGGSGSFRSLWTGSSRLRLTVEGLREAYGFGEPVTARARLAFTAGDAEPGSFSVTSVAARLLEETATPSPVREIDLVPDGEAFTLRIEGLAPGSYEVQMMAQGRDRAGRQLLPRPSARCQFRVLPRFFVVPEKLAFGTVEPGLPVSAALEVHFGLAAPGRITLSSAFIESSRGPRALEDASRLPRIEVSPFEVHPGSVTSLPVPLMVPKDVPWGDLTGRITLRTDSGETAEVPLTLHVKSLWERLTWPTIGLLIGLALLLAYLSWVWGALGMPAGVLVALAAPAGALSSDIRLGEVRRGFWTRYLHWRRNRLTIGRDRASIRLVRLPAEVRSELSFTRSGRLYLRNESSPGVEIVVREEPAREYRLRPGSAFEIKHGSVLDLAGYRYRYDRPARGR